MANRSPSLAQSPGLGVAALTGVQWDLLLTVWGCSSAGRPFPGAWRGSCLSLGRVGGRGLGGRGPCTGLTHVETPRVPVSPRVAGGLPMLGTGLGDMGWLSPAHCGPPCSPRFGPRLGQALSSRWPGEGARCQTTSGAEMGRGVSARCPLTCQPAETVQIRVRPPGASLVTQWFRIHLPTQGTRVPALVQEDPTCRGATKPVLHNY